MTLIYLKTIFFLSLILFFHCKEDKDYYPNTMIWAWERKEDLYFIDPKEVGVSYLALTIQIKNKKIIKRPRLNILNIPKGTYAIPIIRIEMNSQNDLYLERQMQLWIVEEIYRVSLQINTNRIQIDFEVLKSQRDFFDQILKELKRKLKQGIKISITGLVSWCYEDNWVSRLEVDEVVPMLFDMGVEETLFKHRMNAGDFFTEPLCKKSIGISTSQNTFRLPLKTRLYIFHSKSWTKEEYEKIMKRLEK